MKRTSKLALAAAGLAAASALTLVVVGEHGDFLKGDPVLAQLQVGQPAPDFQASDVNGRPVSLADYRGKTVVLEWNNPECPSVQKHYDSGNMQKTQAAAAADGVVWLTINSSAEGNQGYMTPAEAKALVADQQSRRTAYLFSTPAARWAGAMAPPQLRTCTSSTRPARWSIMAGSTTSRRPTPPT